ncbi:uncharacterized protein BDZ99DRAFT_502984 [Mytilinidion resinicola]|uniref:F-box domain-containing protein n=1 Tax=Mytilinidion resinicola TaxID=574789 RepID=A0A6A6Y4J0_9PEZI|nr:uncharacterized protein BDZ99DRAFT_502984 [Mytilinidion resinicola]KAF2803761.1 hypothetical protein BDZ99DRAFT_502984 [Mytilinidion resinicola]
MSQTEAELESFRRQWREEVSARAQAANAASGPVLDSTQPSGSRPTARNPSATEPQSTKSHDVSGALDDEWEPRTYHDLGDRDSGKRLTDSPSSSTATPATSAPRSALEHYEQAVEKESQGSLGDSVDLYRKAFRLDSRVHEAYKNKHFPPSFFQASKTKPQDPKPSNVPATVPNTAHHSLDGLSASLSSLIQDFSSLSIPSEEPPTDLSPAPPCPISTLPEEILVEILLELAIQDVASFVRLAQTCKRLAYLVLTEERVWRRVSIGSEVGFGAMHYDWNCKVNGQPLGDDDEGGQILSSPEIDTPHPVTSLTTTLLVPQVYPNYRALFRSRPRIRFNGCYISTVNYTRPGASSPSSISWHSPIHIVTYYRYLRFFRDGTCVSLLTVAEPADVIPYLLQEHMHTHHSGNLPSAVMKDALAGRWRLSGPAVPSNPSSRASGMGAVEKAVDSEAEGTLHIETAGVTPKYTYKMAFLLGSAGRAARNNKLAWKGYWSYNRLTDDWAEFGLKNDRPFHFSRVKSYGMGM